MFRGDGTSSTVPKNTKTQLTGPCGLSLGKRTYITFLPKQCKGMALEVMEDKTKAFFKVGEYCKVDGTLMIGRLKSSTTTSLLLKHSNVSGCHSTIQGNGGSRSKWWFLDDAESTHLSVMNGTKLHKVRENRAIKPSVISVL
jgi:hypothetical protein